MLPERNIAILLATYNGADFIDEQLDSIARQDWPLVDVWASDDGSADATVEKLAAWQARWRKGAFRILEGPRRGYVENFRSMMANGAVDAAYVAFSDQDDIWDENKLSTAVRKLEEIAPTHSAMYCGRTRLVESDGTRRGASPLFSRAPNFGNAIVQSIGGGNTIVLNRTAFGLVRESARRASFVSHDWWCYQIVAGAGGRVLYDPVPRIGYRQHGGNLIGENQGWRARLKRIRGLAEGRFAAWNATNIEALEACRDLLDENGRRTLDGFIAARQARPLESAHKLWRYGIHRQTRLSNVALYVAALLGKL
ncbi:glycosyltransferase family 2 protein [Nitratireductor sp. ZSWI3]|uniref:glycosyltransferase family 2 protein n=1 Tax=Nitratireductor sp. ZSWI3 TaxID=2966359 RepID=UPI002150178C|nr:glycosyltransferase family 2 protein [Nitratireductor sp. ZSWI3]MCR4265124.1 glycosyltransferase family 2 protein [Nitratireductor sp. ZSWI3]